MRVPTIDWDSYQPGDRLPRFPMWAWSDWRGRPVMEREEFLAMPWWHRIRFNLTEWDPRDISKFPPPDIPSRRDCQPYRQGRQPPV